MKKAIVAGHLCVDITPIIKGEKQKLLTDLLRPGTLINVGDADVHTGGACANTGIAMKIVGADVSLVGKIGNDAFGNIVSSILDEQGVGGDVVVDENVSTSYTFVVAVPGIDRVFLHNPGANDAFNADDVSEDKLKEAALFHFGYPSLMRQMFINDGDGLVALLKKAKDAGCVVSLDLAAVDPNAESGRADWEKLIKRAAEYVDIFVPSVEEVCYVIDRQTYDRWQERAAGRDMTEVLDIENDIKPLAEKCMALGVKILLIKCGAQGMYLCTAEKEKLMPLADSRLELDPDKWASRSVFEHSFVPDAILSGTGCGDTSIGTFLTAMINGETAETAVMLAAAQGASCIAAYDSISGLKTIDELKAKIASGWKKVNE